MNIVRMSAWGVGAVAMVVAASAGWGMSSWGELEVIDSASGAGARDSGANVLSTQTPEDPPGTSATDGTTRRAPSCTVDDRPAEGDPATDWATIAIDATYAIPADFVPPDLVDVSEAGFGTGDQVRQIVVEDLDALRRAAEAAGTPLSLVSAYRSHAYQERLFNSEVEERGQEEAQRTIARPGHSEHQLGTAVDVSDVAGSPLDETFAPTATAQWLADHSHEFGFVISYPDVPPERSCYEHEPWHLRYVGRQLAARVHDSRLTLREWLLTR